MNLEHHSTHTYRTLSFRNTRAQTIPRNDQIYIDWSFAESTIKRNARSSAEVEREIVKAIEDTYFADIMRHEEFEPFIVDAAKDRGFNVTASVTSYESEQNNHEIYYTIDVELTCEDDIDYEEIQDFLEKAFDAFLVQFNYDCDTVLALTIDSEVSDLEYETYDGDSGYTDVEFTADLTIEFDPHEAYNSTTCCNCAISTDEV